MQKTRLTIILITVTFKTIKFSFVANTALSLGKLVIGIITGYIAIVSKAVHALIGLVAALIAYILLSGKPLQHWKKAENMCLNF